MSKYQEYLFDEQEEQELELRREAALEVPGSEGLSSFSVQLTEEEKQANGRQCDIVEAIYHTLCNLLQIDNMELCNQGTYFYFSLTLSEDDKKLLETHSPKLSRKKLLKASIRDLTFIFTSFILDREQWSQEAYISYKLSDGKGNWINHNDK